MEVNGEYPEIAAAGIRVRVWAFGGGGMLTYTTSGPTVVNGPAQVVLSYPAVDEPDVTTPTKSGRSTTAAMSYRGRSQVLSGLARGLISPAGQTQ